MAHQITKLSLIACLFIIGLNACTEDSQNFTNPNPLSSVCDSTKFTYYNVISKIIANNCNDAACHGSGTMNFTTYTGIKPFAKDGSLLGSLKHDVGYKPMPYANQFISDCDIKKIEKWIKNGYPQ